MGSYRLMASTLLFLSMGVSMRLPSLLSLMALFGCSDVTQDHRHDHENELITTVTLTLTAGEETLTASWADPELDGDPIIDTLTLTEGTIYDTSISFLNEAKEPAEDITEEIADEAEEHQVFLTGVAVEGPATEANVDALVFHAYSDQDANGNPIGLENMLEAVVSGSGELIVTLRHLPEEDGQAAKSSDLSEVLATEGFAGIGGDTDVQVAFPLLVE
jgi:hypothetical protein